jgi:hypothetical protein
MEFLDWMNKDTQIIRKSAEEEQKPTPRFKQPVDPFHSGDRVIVYETWHLGREVKPDPHFALALCRRYTITARS